MAATAQELALQNESTSLITLEDVEQYSSLIKEFQNYPDRKKIGEGIDNKGIDRDVALMEIQEYARWLCEQEVLSWKASFIFAKDPSVFLNDLAVFLETKKQELLAQKGRVATREEVIAEGKRIQEERDALKDKRHEKEIHPHHTISEQINKLSQKELAQRRQEALASEHLEATGKLTGNLYSTIEQAKETMRKDLFDNQELATLLAPHVPQKTGFLPEEIRMTVATLAAERAAERLIMPRRERSEFDPTNSIGSTNSALRRALSEVFRDELGLTDIADRIVVDATFMGTMRQAVTENDRLMKRAFAHKNLIEQVSGELNDQSSINTLTQAYLGTNETLGLVGQNIHEHLYETVSPKEGEPPLEEEQRLRQQATFNNAAQAMQNVIREEILPNLRATTELDVITFLKEAHLKIPEFRDLPADPKLADLARRISADIIPLSNLKRDMEGLDFVRPRPPLPEGVFTESNAPETPSSTSDEPLASAVDAVLNVDAPDNRPLSDLDDEILVALDEESSAKITAAQARLPEIPAGKSTYPEWKDITDGAREQHAIAQIRAAREQGRPVEIPSTRRRYQPRVLPAQIGQPPSSPVTGPIQVNNPLVMNLLSKSLADMSDYDWSVTEAVKNQTAAPTIEIPQVFLDAFPTEEPTQPATYEPQSPVTDVQTNVPSANAPAEGMELDPRYQSIKQELKQEWARKNPGEDLINYEQGYQDPNKKHLPTLKPDAEKVFRERHPQAASGYDAKERVRIYKDPNNDPAYKAMKQEAASLANNEIEQKQARGQKLNFDDMLSIQDQRRRQVEYQFAYDYKEKAQVYAKRDEGLQKALAWQERQETGTSPQSETPVQRPLTQQRQQQTEAQTTVSSTISTSESSSVKHTELQHYHEHTEAGEVVGHGQSPLARSAPFLPDLFANANLSDAQRIQKAEQLLGKLSPQRQAAILATYREAKAQLGKESVEEGVNNFSIDQRTKIGLALEKAGFTVKERQTLMVALQAGELANRVIEAKSTVTQHGQLTTTSTTSTSSTATTASQTSHDRKAHGQEIHAAHTITAGPKQKAEKQALEDRVKNFFGKKPQASTTQTQTQEPISQTPTVSQPDVVIKSGAIASKSTTTSTQMQEVHIQQVTRKTEAKTDEDKKGQQVPPQRNLPDYFKKRAEARIRQTKAYKVYRKQFKARTRLAKARLKTRMLNMSTRVSNSKPVLIYKKGKFMFVSGFRRFVLARMPKFSFAFINQRLQFFSRFTPTYIYPRLARLMPASMRASFKAGASKFARTFSKLSGPLRAPFMGAAIGSFIGRLTGIPGGDVMGGAIGFGLGAMGPQRLLGLARGFLGGLRGGVMLGARGVMLAARAAMIAGQVITFLVSNPVGWVIGAALLILLLVLIIIMIVMQAGDSGSQTGTQPQQIPGLTMNKTGPNGCTLDCAVRNGSDIEYTIDVSYSGNADVTISDQIPANTSFVFAGGTHINEAGFVKWSLKDTANAPTAIQGPNKIYQFKLIVHPTQNDILVINKLSATATGGTFTGGGDIAQCTFYRGGNATAQTPEGGIKFNIPEWPALINEVATKVGVPPAALAGILRVECGTCFSSNNPEYIRNDYDATFNGLVYGVMQFYPPTFEGIFRNNPEDMAKFGKTSVRITIDPQSAMAPTSVFRIYSIKDSVIAAAVKMKRDAGMAPPYDRAAIERIVTAYFTRCPYVQANGTFNYCDDLWNSYSRCQPTQSTSTPLPPAVP